MGIASVYIMNSVEEPIPWILVMLVFGVSLYPSIRDVLRGTFDAFEIKNIFIGYYILQFGMWSMFILWTNETKWPIERDAAFNQALLYAIIGIMFFHLGYSGRLGFILCSFFPTPYPKWDGGRLMMFVLVCCAIGATAFVSLISGLGGIDEYLANREYYRASGLTGKGYLIFASTALLAFPLILASCNEYPLLRLQWLVLLIIWVIPTTIIGYRSLLVLPVLQIAIVRNYWRGRIPIRTLVAGLLVIVVIISVFAIWREYSNVLSEGNTELVDQDYAKLGAYALFDNLRRSHGVEVVAVVLDKMEEDIDGKLQWGVSSLIEIVTVPIPRAWFPDKIESVSFRFAKTFFEDYITWGDPSGVSPTVIGELYWNFHVIGITVGMFVVGVVSRSAYVWLRRNRSVPGAVVAYSFVATFAFLFVEAPTVAVNAYLPQLGVLAGVLHAVGRRRIQSI